MWKAVFDSKRLTDIFVDFYKIFNINISIFEPPPHVADFDAIFHYMNGVAYPSAGPSGICQCLRKSRCIDDRCIRCDENAVRHVMETKKTYIYQCHLGLFEVMIPAIYEGNVALNPLISSWMK